MAMYMQLQSPARASDQHASDNYSRASAIALWRGWVLYGPGLGYYGGGGLSIVLLIIILFLLFGRGRSRL
jgi:hypothetical protein